MTEKKTKGRKRKAPARKKGKKKKSARKEFWARWKFAVALVCIAGLAAVGFYCLYVRPYSYRWQPCFGREAYGVCIPGNYKVHGIDISHYQGKVDWQELRSKQHADFPLHFVFMKATEGGTLSDSTFARNFSDAQAYGFVRGAYHFFVPGTDAYKQADFFMRQVDLQEGDLAPVLDVETMGRSSKKDLQRGVKTWLDAVEQHYGVKPIIYTSYKFKEKNLDDPLFDDYPYWIAHYYVDSVRYRGHWEFWQYTDIGEVPGIREGVDLNVFNGTVEDLRKYMIPAFSPVN